MNAFFVPVLVASLAGSLHCAGMCGPFMAAAGGLGSSRSASLFSHAAYHVGRLVTYLGLGIAAGVVGTALDLAGSAAGIARVSAIVSGAVMVLWGVTSLFERPRLLTLQRRAPRRLATALARVLSTLERRPPSQRALLLGLSTTLIPCGWLYAFVVTAAGSGSVSSSLGVMLAFWAGTLPLLLGAGLGLREVFARLGRHARALSASLIVLAGVAVLVIRVEAPAFDAPAKGPAASPMTPAMPANCPLHRR